MKFIAVLALVAVATVVSAELSGWNSNPDETNAGRGKTYGLPWNLPNKLKRATPPAVRRSSPSGIPSGVCKAGQSFCCTGQGVVGKGSNVDAEVNYLGIHVPNGVLAGLDCSPLGDDCEYFRLCCSDNSHNGDISLDCSFLNN